MNGADLQRLAAERIRDARILLAQGQYSGAYYLTGLAIECALKACIARKTLRHDFPDRDFAKQCWDHDLTKLLKLAGLEIALDQASRTNPTFVLNWAVLKDWKVDSRYKTTDEKTAREAYRAATARAHGVMRWIRSVW